MNPFLIIAAELDSDEDKTAEQAKQKPVFAANDDRYSATYYGSKAANE